MRGDPESDRRATSALRDVSLIGAAVLGGVIAVRALTGLFEARQPWESWTGLLIALDIAVGAAVLAVVIYLVIGRPLRRVRYVGPYLAGVVATASFVGAAVASISFLESQSRLDDPSAKLIVALSIVLFGLLIGQLFLRDLTPAQVASEERLNAAWGPPVFAMLAILALASIGAQWLPARATIPAFLVAVALLSAIWWYLRRRGLIPMDPGRGPHATPPAMSPPDPPAPRASRE